MSTSRIIRIAVAAAALALVPVHAATASGDRDRRTPRLVGRYDRRGGEFTRPADYVADRLLPFATGATVMGAALLVWSTLHRPDIALSLVALGVPLTLVERWRPLRRQRSAIRRAGAMTDAMSFVVNEVLAGFGLAVVLAVTVPLIRLGIPPALRDVTVALPGWGRWLLAFVVSEVCGYWGHRLSHEIPALWSLHRVHHSAPALDWLAPSRRHPLDAVIARTSTALPVLVLGLGVPTVVTWFALKRLQGLIVHANIDVRLGVLERVIATPFFHHWHHSDEPGTWNTNYAGSIPAVDWLFGTLLLPDRWPAAYGCGTTVPDVGYVARCLSPWRERRADALTTTGLRQ